MSQHTFTNHRDSHNITNSNVQASFNKNSRVNMGTGRTPPWYAQPVNPEQPPRRAGQAQTRLNNAERESYNIRPDDNPAHRGYASSHQSGSPHKRAPLSAEDEDERAHQRTQGAAAQQDPYSMPAQPSRMPELPIQPPSGPYGPPDYPPFPQPNPDQSRPLNNPPPHTNGPLFPSPTPYRSPPPCFLHPDPSNVHTPLPSYYKNPFIEPPPQQGPARFPSWN